MYVYGIVEYVIECVRHFSHIHSLSPWGISSHFGVRERERERESERERERVRMEYHFDEWSDDEEWKEDATEEWYMSGDEETQLKRYNALMVVKNFACECLMLWQTSRQPLPTRMLQARNETMMNDADNVLAADAGENGRESTNVAVTWKRNNDIDLVVARIFAIVAEGTRVSVYVDAHSSGIIRCEHTNRSRTHVVTVSTT